MTRRVLFVADGGDESGLGHISRSSAVAVALGERGLLATCFANGMAAPFERDGIRWLPLEKRNTFPPSEGHVAVVLDSYRIDATTVRGLPLAVLQESTAPPAHAALVVNASGDPAGGDRRRLHGPAYACLRPAFWRLPPAITRRNVERILVSTGAGDPGGVAPALVQAVRAALPSAQVTVVRGPFAPAVTLPGVEVAAAPESLLPLLLEADLVVTAGGQTMLESVATGTPTVALILVENQVAQAKRLAGLGAVELADVESLEPVVAALASDHERRADLTERAQSAIDGQGALRVADAIARLIQA